MRRGCLSRRCMSGKWEQEDTWIDARKKGGWGYFKKARVLLSVSEVV